MIQRSIYALAAGLMTFSAFASTFLIMTTGGGVVA